MSSGDTSGSVRARDVWIRTDVATMYRAEGEHSTSTFYAREGTTPAPTTEGQQGGPASTISRRAANAVRFSAGKRDGRAISWFDWLLESHEHMGLRVPAELGRPLVVLLSGPPGAGKSQLLQQIGYNRARRWMETRADLLASPGHERDRWNDDEEGSPRTLMVCTETPAPAVVGNMANLGVRNAHHEGFQLFATNDALSAGSKGGRPLFCVATQGVKLERLAAQNDYRSASVGADDFVKGVRDCWTRFACDGGSCVPSLLMIDSLNVFDQARDQAFVVNRLFDPAWYGQAVGAGPTARAYPHVLFVVLDTDPDGGAPGPSAEHLEYLSDVWIRMDLGRFERSDYVGRTIEVIKTRFQARHSGTHMVKIYPGNRVDAGECPTIAEVVGVEQFENSDANGPKPILPAGGIWIALSVPDALSAIRREERLVGEPVAQGKSAPSGAASQPPTIIAESEAAWRAPDGDADEDTGGKATAPPWGVFGGELSKSESPGEVPWPVPWMRYLVRGDIPRKGCVAITGPRSGSKLVVASQFLLDGAYVGEPGLYLSLAERKDLVEQRLQDLAHHADRYPKSSSDTGKDLVEWITVIHQKAGYVYPEEIVQRVLYWIAVKGIRRAVIAPVDHWETSFPLLANSSMLLATLVELFRAHDIPTIVVAHEDQPGDAERCGIMALADVILRFKDMQLKVRASESGDASMWSDEFWEHDISKGFDIDGFVEGTPFLRPKASEATAGSKRPLVAMPFKAIEILRTAAGLPAAHPAAVVRRFDRGGAVRGGWIDLIPFIPRLEE